MFEAVALDDSEKYPELHIGGVVVPKMGQRDRLNKPPLIYWLQGGSAFVFTGGNPHRDAIWMYRVPSVIAALLTTLFTWRLGISMFDRRTGLLAAAMLAVCPMILWDAHQARADQVLLACTISAVSALWAVYKAEKPSWKRGLWLWVSVGLGVLTKGPITPMVVVLTLIAISLVTRKWRWIWRMKPIVGSLVVLAMVVPWVYLVADRVGFSAYWETIYAETIGRSAGSMEGHAGPPGYHFVLSAVLFWPGSLLALAALIEAARAGILLPKPLLPGRFRWLVSYPSRLLKVSSGSDAELFLMAWIVPTWIVFELVATKLPHYALPVYPALAIVSAKYALDLGQRYRETGVVPRMSRPLGNVWVVIGCVLCAGIPIGLSFLGASIGVRVAAYGFAGVCVWLIWSASRRISRGHLLDGHLHALCAAVLFSVVVIGLVMPRAERLWVWSQAAGAVDIDRPIAIAGSFEDSAVFMTRARAELIGADDAEAWLRGHPNGLVITIERPDVDYSMYEEVDSFEGFDYASGDAVVLKLLATPND